MLIEFRIITEVQSSSDMSSDSELIDQYEQMLREILILRASTQSQIKACAVLRDVRALDSMYQA